MNPLSTIIFGYKLILRDQQEIISSRDCFLEKVLVIVNACQETELYYHRKRDLIDDFNGKTFPELEYSRLPR
jgi:hypothetical protein